jgi:DNA-directed RNA polymerase sigma subunit (sigma70/sigma32)
MVKSFNLNPDLTHAEVGFIIGVSEKAAEQIERKALRKIRRLLRDEYGLDFNDLRGDREPAVRIRTRGRA